VIRPRTFGVVVAIAAVILAALGGPASAQAGETIHRYDVAIRIEPGGSVRVTETIDYDFGSSSHHGIYRDVPTTLRFDGRYDRVYPLRVEGVTASGGASADYEVEAVPGGTTRIRIGDPDRLVTGDHTYVLTYVVDAALNGFADHDELAWNAIGTEWSVPIERATVRVDAPGPITAVACQQGPYGSGFPCTRARKSGTTATFSEDGLGPAEGLTVVVALPTGVVPTPRPELRERWTFARAFSATPATVAGAGALLALVVGLLTLGLWRVGRDRRYRGSPVDQVLGSADGAERTVPLFEGGAAAPVEFAPPDGVRPGEMGTLIDERANVLDVSATIVDLAVRGLLTIEEIPKHGLFGKPDWTLRRTKAADESLLPYERTLLDGLFRDVTEVRVSALRTTFVERLTHVQDRLYEDAVRKGWFATRPDRVRGRWRGWGVLALIVGGALTWGLARWTHLGLLGIPIVLGGVVLAIESDRMPARTAKGTAMLRRVRGFRTVIEKAEANMARWAEQENVFTRYLPFAIVFGCTDTWARAFEAIGAMPPDSTWYVGAHPFTYAAFADSMDHFAVTTGGTIAATPAGSGGSGFGGFSGGGGGGGGGGSW